MTESEFRQMLDDALFDYAEENGEEVDTRSFEQSGLLTRDEGLVVRMDDGSEFQLTIVRSA